jgi:hypothetical protein
VVPGTPFFLSPEMCKAAFKEFEEDEKARRASNSSSSSSNSLRASSSLRDSSSHGASSTITSPVSLVNSKVASLARSAMDEKADIWALGITAIQVCMCVCVSVSCV